MPLSDNFPTYRIPISIKGIIIDDGKVWLRKNDRGEWELPGGKIDRGEQPNSTLIREIEEELGFKVLPDRIIDCFIRKIDNSIDEQDGVLVVIYHAIDLDKTGQQFEIIGECEFKAFSSNELDVLNIWPEYKLAIKKVMES